VREQATAGGAQQYSSVVVLRVIASDGTAHTVEGVLGADGSPRLVKWGQYEIEAHLGGPTLVITNLDRPGVIGFVGTTLGDAQVNVARVHLGIAKPGGAVSVWNLDGDLPSSVVEELRRSPNILSAVTIRV
jgi:D-3-phosphoglycerate dehydrogenase